MQIIRIQCDYELQEKNKNNNRQQKNVFFFVELENSQTDEIFHQLTKQCRV